jgi:hypothetical protein
MVGLRQPLRGRAAFPLTGIISAIVDESVGVHGLLWRFCPTGDVSIAVVGEKEVVPNLLQDFGKGCFVHFDKLLSQVSFGDPWLHADQSPPVCLGPC